MSDDIERVPDWPAKLFDYIEIAKTRPFEWGAHDCALFAANWVQLATNVDPAKTYRRRYKSAIGAARVLRNDGETLEAAVDRALSGRSVAPPFARRGDVALIEGDLGPTCGIVIDSGRVAAPALEGLAFFPVADALRVWRV